MSKTILNIGLEVGNRTSVMALGPYGNTSKEKVLLQPTTFKAHQEKLGLLFSTGNQAPVSQTIYHDDQLYYTGESCDGHEGSMSFNSIDKYRNSAGLQIIFKSLLAQMLPRNKSASYSANINFGMPIGWTNQSNIDNVKQALAGKHELKTKTTNFGTVEVKAANVNVYHEPLGAYVYKLVQTQGNFDTAHIIDIGYNTTDLLAIHNGVLVNGLTDTLDYGMHDLYLLLQKFYQPLEGYRRPVAYWETFVKTYDHNSNNPTVGKAFNTFLGQLGNKIMAVWSGIHNKPNLITVGGGGDFIYPYFQKLEIEGLTNIDKPQLANALGLLYILLKDL